MVTNSHNQIPMSNQAKVRYKVQRDNAILIPNDRPVTTNATKIALNRANHLKWPNTVVHDWTVTRFNPNRKRTANNQILVHLQRNYEITYQALNLPTLCHKNSENTATNNNPDIVRIYLLN